MITENQLFLIDMHLRDVLNRDAELLGWTLTILRKQGDVVKMETISPGGETITRQASHDAINPDSR